ncbi:MAG TPA: ABC transporter substrate-binding protein [Gemmatimonadales bacterium]|nr:ABC transporter substrate-binding protein [Gemmatimonadales bacterium]
MDRRAFLVGTAGLLAAPLAAGAQQAEKVYRVGYLTGNSVEGDKGLRSAFQQGLADLGYVDGKNVVIEARYAAGDFKRVPSLAAELVQSKVDVIVASATAVTDAKAALAGVPTVFVIADDPVATGLVASLARPAGHMTGLTSLNINLDGKRLEILKATLPAIRRVGVLSAPRDRAQRERAATVGRAAHSLGLQLQFLQVSSMDQLARVIDAAGHSRVEALMVLGAPAFRAYQAQTAQLVAKTRLPMVSAWRDFPEAGGLLSYGTSVPAMFRRAARFVDKILKGANPADLPVEQPTAFELVINLKTAKALGLTIPPSLLQRADQVIE